MANGKERYEAPLKKTKRKKNCVDRPNLGEEFNAQMKREIRNLLKKNVFFLLLLNGYSEINVEW